MEVSEARLMGLEAGARYLGITVRTLYRLVALGSLRPVRLPGFRRTLFDRTDLDVLVEEAKGRETTATSESQHRVTALETKAS